MSESPKIELNIRTTTVNAPTGTYSIAFEAINPVGITPYIFVVSRTDNESNSYIFNRVASVYDIHNLQASSVTENDSYRVSKFSVESTSIVELKKYKDNIPRVVQNLLDSVAKGIELDVLVGTDTTITLTGEAE